MELEEEMLTERNSFADQLQLQKKANRKLEARCDRASACIRPSCLLPHV